MSFTPFLAQAAGGGEPSALMSLLPLVAIFVIFWFLLIRPQQKKMKEHKAMVEAVKRGVMLAGGLPMEFPTISLHESFSFPTSMYLRNLMSMDTEEMMRALPMDACVLIGGCDKTVPAQLMDCIGSGSRKMFFPISRTTMRNASPFILRSILNPTV